MMRKFLVPDREHREELIDSFDHPEEAFAKSFRDIRRINRCFGGTSVMRRELDRLLPARSCTTLLDIGTGSGDIPEALVAWARSRGSRLSVVGLDANPKVLRYAQASARPDSQIELVAAEAQALPFPDDSFDIVCSSLTFHHFEDALAVQILQEMSRVARQAVIVNDLQRAYAPAALIWLVTRLAGMHSLTRHDAPLSVLKARTLDEYRLLAEAAGFVAVQVRPHPFWRAAVVLRNAK